MAKMKLQNEYKISKTSGEAIDPKAEYLILRLDKNSAAREAAILYSVRIAVDDPILCANIRAKVFQLRRAEGQL